MTATSRVASSGVDRPLLSSSLSDAMAEKARGFASGVREKLKFFERKSGGDKSEVQQKSGGSQETKPGEDSFE